jgi:alkaline phosphatase D
VAFESASGRSEATGAFRTAPAAETSRRVTFLVGGDLGGQAYCRHAEHGYRIFRAAADLAPDFFIANGDMIYADSSCPERSPEGAQNVPGDFPAIHEERVDWTDVAQLDEVYRAHWRYNRADSAFQAFLRRTPMFVQWDDHEVINDFGVPWPSHPAAPERAGYPNLVATGRRVFFEWHPLRRDAREPERIHRAARWGKHAELFLLDARSHRSPNRALDAPEARKTLLGPAQLAWLKEGLERSTATWKVVSSDVPLSVPTGSRAETFGRDAFASGDADSFSASTGFERELMDLVRFLDANDVRNVVFVATDVHFAAQIRYAGDYDGDGDAYVFHELISGPLSAAKTPSPRTLDATLHPVVLYAEGGIFNFAHVRIEDAEDGVRLFTDVRDDAGVPRPGSGLSLRAE